jgi:hypothetical protein
MPSLQDKHGHVYQIVALSHTNVNLKGSCWWNCRPTSFHVDGLSSYVPADRFQLLCTALSTRLGLGKAPLQPLPGSALPALLQSPAHVTFLGLAGAASQQVVSLLDAQAAAEPLLSIPAADGSGEITMSGADTEKFLRYTASMLSIK